MTMSIYFELKAKFKPSVVLQFLFVYIKLAQLGLVYKAMWSVTMGTQIVKLCCIRLVKASPNLHQS